MDFALPLSGRERLHTEAVGDVAGKKVRQEHFASSTVQACAEADGSVRHDRCNVVPFDRERQAAVLLIDEADNAGLAHNEDLRVVINEGVYREAVIGRVVGDDHTPKLFPVFAPVILAGIGRLPGPVVDRSIKIALRRKLKNEKRTRFDRRNVGHLVDLARQAARIGLDHAAELESADPSVPEELNDRELDSWRPLLAIADLAGGGWPKKARDAAKALSERGDDDEEEAALMMFRDCRVIFRKLANLVQPPPTEIETANLVEHLHKLADSSWSEWGRMMRPINGAGVAKLLKNYEIKPGFVGPRDDRKRGYTWAQFDDAWSRYLADIGKAAT